jgi:hypothetical protein
VNRQGTLLTVVLLLAFAMEVRADDSAAPVSTAEAELRAILRDRKGTLVTGDLKVWSRNVSPDCIWVDDSTKIDTTADVEKDLGAARASGKRADIADLKVAVHGDAAVLTYLENVRTVHNGKEVVERFRELDTYVRLDGRWQLVAASETPVPPIADAAKAIKVSPRILDEYVGRYQFDAGNVLRVWREGDHLMAQNNLEDKPEPMFAESETVFFDKLGPWRWIFVKDAKGKVVHLVYRSRGIDIEMPKVK